MILWLELNHAHLKDGNDKNDDDKNSSNSENIKNKEFVDTASNL